MFDRDFDHGAEVVIIFSAYRTVAGINPIFGERFGPAALARLSSGARAHARLGLAVVRGLLLDLLATGDRAGVDASLEIFARRYAGLWWEAEPPPDGPAAGPAGAAGPERTVSARAS